MNPFQALKTLKPVLVTLFISCAFFNNAAAQLVANFTVDKQNGCSPLSVKFSNTSTGSSAGTTWQWNFGNGNTSTLKDPGATYFTEKTYTVTLTAKDGATSSVKTMDITVYKKPTVDFTVSPAKGCVPLDVRFTANATPGDGTLASYLWDFGDGATVQGSGFATTQHIYTFVQVPPITLNVTNSFGCYTTISKSNQVEVVAAVQAAFSPSTTTLCNAGEAITFNNTSTGSGTLTYTWDFGDSKTSTEKSPVHIYASSGSFTAKLTATSSDGCSSTVQSAVINVANFKADFDITAKICLGQQIGFNNTSTRPFDRAEWYIDNNSYGYSTYDGTLYTSFYTEGEHEIKLTTFYGNCSATVTKKIMAYGLPKLVDFIADLQGACGTPVTINYKDTSSDAVSWQWQNSYTSNTSFASTKNTSFTYTSGNYEYVYLTTTNAAGCTATVGKYINYEKPNINITLKNASVNQGCKPIVISFAAYPDTAIATYKWNFGDNTATSTEATPTHNFNTAGSFSVTLSYVTKNGCAGTSVFSYVTVVDKPVFDFTANQTICGNTPTTFSATPAASGWNYYWSFNDDYSVNYNGSSSVVKQFYYDTIYTVKMIAQNNGCIDTVIKTNYVKVLPPFPHIKEFLNTCDAKRGDVRFTEDSKKALKWTWEFGDGATETYTAFKDTIRHTYNTTGTYKVVLNATNGACTVRDSLNTYVLLKQKPLLTSTKSDACGNTTVDFKLNNFEKNPYPYLYSYNYGYGIQSKEYNDFTPSNAQVSSNNYYWEQEYQGFLDGLDPGKSGIRFITTSYFFGCADTSNFMPIKIHGPKAGFKIEPHSGCFKEAVKYTDTSTYSGVSKIIKWDWNFGDGKTQTLTAAGSATHLYAAPGTYYVTLTVTDIDGCFNATQYYNNTITVSGPKADFSASAYTVPPNTTVYLSNTSQYYYYYSYTSSAKWKINDSTIATDDYGTNITFTNAGVYPVTLITINSITGCPDTITKTITVRKVNSAFTYSLSYINNNACPPVIASFRSISTNAVRVAWDFGDGGIAGNQLSVSHTYNQAGIYRVVHYSYDGNIGVDSTEDFIEVKGPYALLKADQLTGCSSLEVKLTADVKYASGYTWDFGDGTVVPTTDTFAIHNYVTPGVYIPALILKDAGGCTATSNLPEKVIVDSLFGTFRIAPSIICDSAISVFTPSAASLSNDALQVAIQYTWVITEGNKTDSFFTSSASHLFNKIGVHSVKLILETPYGCKQTITDSVIVKQGVRSSIAGPGNICRQDKAVFTGKALPLNIPYSWNWDFKNGATSSLQNPLSQQYVAEGLQQISLIVSNGYCSDTAYHSLLVKALPNVSIAPAEPFVCKGSNINLSATGGISYQWSAASAINNSAAATIYIGPAQSGYYVVKVTDAENCSSTDSVYVKLISPFTITASPNLFACQGNAVQLGVSGADKYKWIGNTAGISDISLANPSALTNNSVSYRVVGYDNYNCFTDTAKVAVRISPLPIVNAGNGKELIAGTSAVLQPAVSGATGYIWSPADYLSCTSCLNPVSIPKSSTTYTLTAYNADGCKASDTVQLRLVCASNLVFIPNAFSPNNDNVNDRFNITGSGIKSLRSVSVYNRFGRIVFQRKNISANDKNNSWDGMVNGEPVMPGTYVYFIQAECEGGQVFYYRGTIMVVR